MSFEFQIKKNFFNKVGLLKCKYVACSVGDLLIPNSYLFFI